MIPTNFKFLSLTILLLLTACGGAEMDELKTWMDAEKKSARVVTPKISPPKVYVPVPYAGKNEIAPFDRAKLLVVLARLKAASSNGLEPDLNRPKEVLESFPLDTMNMVGMIEKDKIKYALVKAEKTIYQVKLGNYLGQNYGMVVGITDSEVEIKEIVQDAAGEWVERMNKLELQESTK